MDRSRNLNFEIRFLKEDFEKENYVTKFIYELQEEYPNATINIKVL